jgi:hypothetical protein
MNPLLKPSEFEDQFTSPNFLRDEFSTDCIVTMPAYITIKLAGKPSSEPNQIARSGFEESYLTIPATGPQPSFRTYLIRTT